MRYSGHGHDLTFTSDANLSSTGLYRFVVAASTTGYAKLAATAGGSVLGICQNNPAAGQPMVVRVAGTSKLEIDSASPASYGKYLKTGSDGQGLGYESITASVYGNAVALDAVTSGSGIRVEVLLAGMIVG